MDYAACNVIYVDRNARTCRLVKRGDATMALLRSSTASGVARGTDPPDGHVYDNLEMLLESFSSVHLCNNGKSCMATLTDLDASCVLTLVPTIVLVDIPYHEKMDEREQSPGSSPMAERFPDQEASLYGLNLLRSVISEIKSQNLSKLVVPVAYVTIPEPHDVGHTPTRPKSMLNRGRCRRGAALDTARTLRYLDFGAVDILTSPFLRDRLPGLAAHAYRAYKETVKEQRAVAVMKRGRKRSWVGLDDQKPYAYLREAMVSGLMDGICRLGDEDEAPPSHMKVVIQSERREKIVSAVSLWHFSAHEFSDDELLHGAMMMLQHALSMPELKSFRITEDNLTRFLMASRSAYNTFVPYHNFRHVVDVLQATFSFLVAIGSLPRFPTEKTPQEFRKQSPLAALIKPVDALTLLIAAIGHDVGHPGVNNAFLVNLNAPLAQLYNDRSVLEAFHCAAYSQILRRHWPTAFADRDMRELMISSILATDMGLHFDYMKKLGHLQEKLSGDGLNGRTINEQKTLACSLIIKCADISNVARSFEVATQWTMILNEEWARQLLMEQDLSIPTALLSPPVREMVEIGKGLLGFMNTIVIPLFQGVADVLPDTNASLTQLLLNKSLWEHKLSEQDKRRKFSDDSLLSDSALSPRSGALSPRSGALSPRSLSIATPPEEGLDTLKTARLARRRSEEASLADPVRIFVDGIPSQDSDTDSIRRPLSQMVSECASPSVSFKSPESEVNGHSSRTLAHSKGDLKNGEIPSAKSCKSRGTDGTDATLVTTNGCCGARESDALSESVRASDLAKQHLAKQRSSDTTDGRTSMPSSGDGISQAPSAATSRLPRSPSTRDTSITSHESRDQQLMRATWDSKAYNGLFDRHASRHRGRRETESLSPGTMSDTSEEPSRQQNRALKHRTSLFRLPRFWHRKGSGERETATVGGGDKGEDVGY